MSFAFARQASTCRPDQLTGLSYPMKKTLRRWPSTAVKRSGLGLERPERSELVPTCAGWSVPLGPVMADPLAGSQSTAKPLSSDASATSVRSAMPTRQWPPSSDQNTADRLSDVIDEATPSFTTSGSLSAHFTTRAPLAYKRAAPRPSVPVKRDLSPAGRGTPTLAAKPRPS